MTLEEISSLGQMVAADATAVPLVLVGLQIRQNTRATRAASHALPRKLSIAKSA